MAGLRKRLKRILRRSKTNKVLEGQFGGTHENQNHERILAPEVTVSTPANGTNGPQVPPDNKRSYQNQENAPAPKVIRPLKGEAISDPEESEAKARVTAQMLSKEANPTPETSRSNTQSSQSKPKNTFHAIDASARENGRVQRVKAKVLKTDPTTSLIKKHNGSAQTALFSAVRNGEESNVQLLLSHGIPDAQLAEYRDCVTHALKHSAPILSLLVTHGTNLGFWPRLTKWYCTDKDGRMLLSPVEADHLDILLPSVEPDHKQDLMLFAVRASKPDIVSTLLKTGLNPDYDNNHQSYLPEAAWRSNAYTLNQLLPHIKAPNALSYVSGVAYQPIAALLVSAQRGDASIVRALLDAGCNVSIADQRGATALHVAARWNHCSVLSVLLDHGADIEARDDSGATALHDAASRGQVGSTRLLLSRGASWVAKTKKGMQPVHLAGEKGHKEVFNVLRHAAGLQAVVGESYDPRRDGRNGNGVEWRKESRLLESTTKAERYDRVGTVGPGPWPALVQRDPKSKELYVVGPEEGGYWN